MNILRNMKKRVLGVFLILVLITSCKKLKVEYFDLTSDCKPTGINWADTLRQPEKGIHYVEIDTSTCRLIVKYDESKATVRWIHDYLIRNHLEFIPKIIPEDTLIDSDTLGQVLNVIEIVEKSKLKRSKPKIVEQGLKDDLIEEGGKIKSEPLKEVAGTKDTIDDIIEDTL